MDRGEMDVEALRQRVLKLREERNKRQAARLQLLKDLHLQKIPRESLYLSSSSTASDASKSTSKFNNSTLPKGENVQNKTDRPRKSLFPAKADVTKASSVKIENVNKRKSLFPKNDGVAKLPSDKIDKRKSLYPKKDDVAKPPSDKIDKINKRKSLYPKKDDVAKPPSDKIDKINKRISLYPKNDDVAKLSTNAQSSQNGGLLKKTGLQVEKNTKTTTDRKSLFPNLKASKPVQGVESKNTSQVSMKQPNTVPVVKNTSKPANKNKVEFKIPPKLPAKNVDIKNAVNRLSKIPDRSIKTHLPGNNPKLNESKRNPIPQVKKIQPTVLGQHNKPVVDNPSNLRRSLSTVHFKRLGPEAAKHCYKRAYSMGNIKHKEIEDELPQDFLPDDYVLPVKSEHKKSVSFFTPMKKNSTPVKFLNTPKPHELRRRLNDWLQKRGKSLSHYHHLKCFGLDTNKESQPINKDSIINVDDDEDDNKENIEVMDDGSFNENACGEVTDNVIQQHRTNGENNVEHVNGSSEKSKSLSPLISEALYDLNQLILEDYSWLQCAEWLRVIVRECGDDVKNVPAYWECRAALEERRGDFVRTVECFNNALLRGAQESNVAESLDHLLEKFMKLNLHPGSENEEMKIPEQKLIDVKNVFKSSLIRFAITRHNMDELNGDTGVKKKYVATPVRRSHRLSTIDGKVYTSSQSKLRESVHNNTQTKQPPAVQNGNTNERPVPKERKHLVQLCESLRNVDDDIKQTLIFVPNKALNFNDCL